jgi:hypothetical protein
LWFNRLAGATPGGCLAMMARTADAEEASMSDDGRHELIATTAVEAARRAGLDVKITVCDEVPVLVGPPAVEKGQATEDAPLIEQKIICIQLDTDYIIALYPGRYVAFQRHGDGAWRRRKTPKRNHYKSLRQALVDIFLGIIWDRMRPLKAGFLGVDRRVLNGKTKVQSKKLDLADNLRETLTELRDKVAHQGRIPSSNSRKQSLISESTNEDINRKPSNIAEVGSALCVQCNGQVERDSRSGGPKEPARGPVLCNSCREQRQRSRSSSALPPLRRRTRSKSD